MNQSVTKNIPTLAVIDFGSQYNQLIARQVRELGVYSELFPYNVSMETLKENNVQGLIFTGGPRRVLDEDAFKVDPAIYDLGLPILAIGYGGRLMVDQLGGKITESEQNITEIVNLHIQNDEVSLFNGLSNNEKVWQGISDQIIELPAGFEVIGKNDDGEISAIFNEEKNFYGVQFHPEVSQTDKGKKLLKTLQKIFVALKATGTWDNLSI